MEEHLFIVERQLRANAHPDPREQPGDDARAGARPGEAHGHAGGAPDGARDGRARDRTREIPALFACVRAARSRVASGQISRACGTRQPLETAPLCQPASF